MKVDDGLRRFRHPTLLVWGAEDPHAGPEWGRRLLPDVPGAVRLELLPETGQLLMEERPECVAEPIDRFLGEALARRAS